MSCFDIQGSQQRNESPTHLVRTMVQKNSFYYVDLVFASNFLFPSRSWQIFISFSRPSHRHVFSAWVSVCLYFCFGKEEGKATRLPFHKRVKRCRGYEKDDEIHEQDEGVAVQSQITRSNHISHESHSHTFGSLGMRRDGRKEVDVRQQQQQQKKLMIRR